MSNLKKIELPPRGLKTLFGVQDQNIKYLEALLDINIGARGNELMIDGDPKDIKTVEKILKEFADLFSEGRNFSDGELRDAFKQIAEDRAYSLKDHFKTLSFNPSGKKQVAPKTANQRKYIEAIQNSDLVFGIGPAGTGKSFLGVAMAVQALFEKQVSRIILTRPAVEAGEKLGFLPGDLQDKVDPYLRPLYDALFDLVETEKVTKMLEKRIIEIAPLAFMRGRAQPLESLLFTPTGWKKMGEIKKGDLVIGSNGRATKVTGVFPQGLKKVFRVTMTDGSSTLACNEHLWQVKTMEDKRRNSPPRILETQEMIENFRRNQQYRYEIPILSNPIEWEFKKVPIEPYSLGLLLGDGCISDKTSPSFTTNDFEFLNSLKKGLVNKNLRIRKKSRIDYVISNPFAGKGGNKFEPIQNSFTIRVRKLNLAGTKSSTKFIPKIYLFNSSDVRIALLQGLLDSDGGPSSQKGRNCRVQYSTTSEKLKDDMVFLIRSLGGIVSCRIRKAEGRKPGFASGRKVFHRKDSFILEIRLPLGIVPFRLKRKAEIYEKYGAGRPMRFIKNIEYVGKMKTQCIKVEADDSLYLTDDFILTHNTLADAFIILDEAQNTTSEQMKMFLTRIGFGSKTVVTGDKTQIDLPFGKKSGIKEAEKILKNLDGIEFVHFTEKDVVRHKLVQMIVKAYDKYTLENENQKSGEGQS